MARVQGMFARAVSTGLSAALAFGLCGCGFTPLYGAHDGHSAVAALSQVDVALIQDRNGQILRQALQDRLERGSGTGSTHYDLYVYLALGEGAVAVDQQSASTRARDVGTAAWTLKAQDAGHTTLTSGSAHSLDGFDIINQQFFAADMSREAADRRIADALADQITQQLAVYFRLHPSS